MIAYLLFYFGASVAATLIYLLGGHFGYQNGHKAGWEDGYEAALRDEWELEPEARLEDIRWIVTAPPEACHPSLPINHQPSTINSSFS